MIRITSTLRQLVFGAFLSSTAAAAGITAAGFPMVDPSLDDSRFANLAASLPPPKPPISPPFGPNLRLFQEPLAKSKFLAGCHIF